MLERISHEQFDLFLEQKKGRGNAQRKEKNRPPAVVDGILAERKRGRGSRREARGKYPKR